MLDTSSDAPCVSRIAKRCKKSFVILSTDIPHIKMLMVILKIPCGSDVIHVQNEGGASTQRRTGAAPQHVVFLQSEGDHNHNQPILSLLLVQESNKRASSEMANCFPRCVPVLVRLGSRQSSSITPCHQVEGGRQK